MGKEISGLTSVKWYQKKWVGEVVSSVPPLVGACIAAYRLFLEPATVLFGYISAAAAVWLLGASALKTAAAVRQDKKEHASYEHDGLRGAMHIVHAAVTQACGLSLQDGLKQIRVTFHRVVPPVDKAETYEQIINYVGRTSSGIGRKFNVRTGIVGKAIRKSDVYVAQRQNDDVKAFQDELISNWSYAVQDAKNASIDAMAWMAIPVTDVQGHDTVGVVYIDSTDRTAFTGEERRSAIVMACAGLTRYVGERY